MPTKTNSVKYTSGKLYKYICLLLMIVLLSTIASGCFFEEDEEVTRDMISDEQIINAVKYSQVASNYNITYDEMFTTMFEKVEYNYYTLEEMKKLVADPDHPDLRDSVEVRVQYPNNGKSFVFAWNVIFHEDLPDGFRLEKKCILDCQTQKTYSGQEMDDNITELLMQKLVVDRMVEPLEIIGSLVPQIN